MILNENNPEKIIEYLYKIKDNLRVEIRNDLKELEVLVAFLLDYRSGKFEYEKEDVKYWIKTRVPRKNRLNIENILKTVGLIEYNDWELFKAYKGRKIGDGIYIYIYIEKIE